MNKQIQNYLLIEIVPKFPVIARKVQMTKRERQVNIKFVKNDCLINFQSIKYGGIIKKIRRNNYCKP